MEGFDNIATTRKRLIILRWVAHIGDLTRIMNLIGGNDLTPPEREYLLHWHSKYQYRRLKRLGASGVVLREMRKLIKSRSAPFFILVL